MCTPRSTILTAKRFVRFLKLELKTNFQILHWLSIKKSGNVFFPHTLECFLRTSAFQWTATFCLSAIHMGFCNSVWAAYKIIKISFIYFLDTIFPCLLMLLHSQLDFKICTSGFKITCVIFVTLCFWKWSLCKI